MPAPGLFDHLFVVYLALVFPLVAWRNFPALVAKIRAGGEPVLIAAYRSTVLAWAAHLGILLALWVVTGRAWEALGFRLGSPANTLLGLLLAALPLGLFAWQGRRQLSRMADRAALEEAIGHVAVFLPQSRREERWFRIVSLNAGITEEILFRAYLYWYLSHWLGPAAAAAGTVVAFTAGHLYQGLRQLPGIALMGAFTILLYLVSDSILIPIVTHALVDMIQGRTAAGLLRQSEASQGTDTGA